MEDAPPGVGELVRGRRDVDAEEARRHAFDVHGAHAVGQSLLVPQLEEEASALSGQDLGHEVERVAVRIVDGEPGEAHHQVCLGALLAQADLLDALGARVDRRCRRREAKGDEVAQADRDGAGDRVGVDVARHGEHEILGPDQPIVVGVQDIRVEARDGVLSPSIGSRYGWVGNRVSPKRW